MNWMELCHTRDGPGVVYALEKPLKLQEKTRVSMGERPAGGRARAWKFVTRNVAALTGSSKVEIRLRTPILFERINYCGFFELPIAILAHLSFEDESIPCGAKCVGNPSGLKFKKRQIDFEEHGLLAIMPLCDCSGSMGWFRTSPGWILRFFRSRNDVGYY